MSAFLGLLDGFPWSSRNYADGELLFRRGSPIEHLFVVEAGLVHLLRYQEDGAPAVMQRAGAGTVVAEASLFADRYHCDGLVVSDARLRRIPIRLVRERIATDAGVARACAEHLSREVQRMRLRAEILGMRTVGRRLDAWLAFNALPPKGEWSNAAEDIGVTREALYRELAARRSSGRPA